MDIIRKLVSRARAEGLDFVLSDSSVDRYGDIVESGGWELANFKKNPVALFNHDASFPIGVWQDVAVRDGALRGRLKLAPPESSNRIREIHKLIEANVLKSVSVGFCPLEYEPRRGNELGYIYTKQELVECSLVAIPANVNALMTAKALKISAATQRLVFKLGKETRKSYSEAETKALMAKARTMLARSPQKRATTKAEAKAIHDYAKALLARPIGVPPLYTRAEMRMVHERAKSMLARLTPEILVERALDAIEHAVTEIECEVVDYFQHPKDRNRWGR
jgi:HK97 family phage prohead protease